MKNLVKFLLKKETRVVVVQSPYVGSVMAWKSVHKWEATPTLQVGFDVLWNWVRSSLNFRMTYRLGLILFSIIKGKLGYLIELLSYKSCSL